MKRIRSLVTSIVGYDGDGKTLTMDVEVQQADKEGDEVLFRMVCHDTHGFARGVIFERTKLGDSLRALADLIDGDTSVRLSQK